MNFLISFRTVQIKCYYFLFCFYLATQQTLNNWYARRRVSNSYGMKDKVWLVQARLGYVRFLDEFESPGLPGSLRKIIRVIEYFKIEYFGITTPDILTLHMFQSLKMLRKLCFVNWIFSKTEKPKISIFVPKINFWSKQDIEVFYLCFVTQKKAIWDWF